jgi:peptidoglycan hydrolase CwlO-like protein
MLVEKSSNNLHNTEIRMNSAILVSIIAALLGGGGVAALIQIVLLPRTMARTRADTTQVLVGTATETVALVRGELGRSKDEVEALERKLSEARGRMQEQDAQMQEQRDKISDQNRRISEQDDEIHRLVGETSELRNQIRLLEQRVRAVSHGLDGIESE